ncbi:acetate transporter [Botrytis cinerea]
MVDKIRSRDVESGCLKDIDTEQSLRGYSIHVVQQSFGSKIGSPTALAIGAFATTLTTLSCALMGFRGLSNTDVFVANFNFWYRHGDLCPVGAHSGNSYGYTVLSAFGLFYAGFGALDIPFLGITAAYGNDTVQYNNALGFFVLLWSVFNLFFLIGSLPINLVYIAIFFFVQLAFTLVSASYFCAADGNVTTAAVLKKIAGAFAFIAGMFGYYTVGHLMCQEALFFDFPMGDTSRFFRRKLNDQRPVPQHHEKESQA